VCLLALPQEVVAQGYYAGEEKSMMPAPENRERPSSFMEPLDTDMDYMVRGPRTANPDTRFNVMLVLPVIGILLLLVFIIAATFQLNLSDLVDSLMGLMILFFFVFIALLFWAMAPRAHGSSSEHE